jgi:hypothetical protein
VKQKNSGDENGKQDMIRELSQLAAHLVSDVFEG